MDVKGRTRAAKSDKLTGTKAGREGVKVRARIALIWLLALPLAPAAAQEDDKSYPSRAIHIVVPFPAGGPADLVSRVIAQKMSESFGVPVVVDNRGGGNTIIGAQAVARAAPDGYTLLLNASSHVINASLYERLPYDPIKDFTPVSARRRILRPCCSRKPPTSS